ncbi:MAG: ABC transporter substrate-binding protein [Oceanospirillaceae bacterium]|nr:ABC transporter substrate-binding protein [Oceanospirillaceae bacterium]
MKALNKTLLTAAVAAMLSGAALADGISDGKVKIGVMADMGGPFGDLCGRGCVTAVEMAVEDFGGSVAGAPIELVTADDQNKPDLGSAKAREWIESENVDAITGLVNSAVTGAVSQILTDNRKPALIATSASNVFTTSQCSAFNAHWTYDVVALANGTVKPMVSAGKKKWFFITVDYALGHKLEETASDVVAANGGEVVGAVRAPLGTTDFSSYILQAQASGADVVALANTGTDFVNATKTAAEFGLTDMIDLVGLLVFTPDIQALDPAVIGGMKLTTGFYWDYDDATRDWSKRFIERHGRIPSMGQAGAYSVTMNYLKAIEATDTDDGETVMRYLKTHKPDDFFARNAYLRADGRMVHDMYQVRVKKADERRDGNDIFEIENVIAGDQAFAPMLAQCEFN